MQNMQDFDGFISKRDKGHDFAVELVSYLRSEYSIRAAWQNNLEKVDPKNHERAARTAIGDSCFTVVVVSEEGVAASFKTKKGSHQLREIQAAAEVRRIRGPGDPPHGIFIVHLIDDDSTQSREDLEILLEREAGIERKGCFVYRAPTAKDDCGEWDSTVEEMAARIHRFLASNGIELAKKREMKRRAQADTLDAVVLTEAERTYLDTHLATWLTGQVEPTAWSGGIAGEGLYRHSALFEFDATRCLSLEGIKVVRPSSDMDIDEGIDGAKRRPILKYVFAKKGKPVMLLGTAGAGKSTTLTIAAALCAGRVLPELRDRASDLFATDMGKLVLDPAVLQEACIPILMRCSTLADAFDSDNQGFMADRRALEDLILKALDTDPGPAARESLQHRMKQQCYMIILDALDEVIDSHRASRIVTLAKGLYARHSSEDLRVEVLISSRKTDIDLQGIYAVNVADLRISQIKAYFDVYAQSLTDVGHDGREAFQKSASDQFDHYNSDAALGHENMQDFLSLPFNLNCFCWLVREGQKSGAKQAPLTQTAFFRTIVERLIEDVRPKLEIDGMTVSPGLLRVLLQRLAYDALSSGKDGTERGKLSLEEARRICLHTLSVASAYQTDQKRLDVVTDSPDYPDKLLEILCGDTDLLIREGQTIRFGRYRFCEYLAGERIDSDALATAMLAMLDAEALDSIIASLCFCYALRLEWNVANYANNVLNGLLRRARIAESRNSDEGYVEMLQWLDAALSCVRSGVETDFGDDARSVLNTAGYDIVRQTAVNLIRKCTGKVDPRDRADTITNLLRLGRRPKTENTVIAVRDLVQSLEPMPDRWVPFQIENADGSTRWIEVERTPVLVCEFEKFLDDLSQKDDWLWTHTPRPADRKCLDAIHEVDEDGWAPSEEWRVLRRQPGNPMVFVTWYEAVAYARWADMKARERGEDAHLRLPTVGEMKQVCRTVWDGREYPWSDGAVPKSVTNCRDFAYGKATPPGTFSAQRGLTDIGSNVSVWTVRDTMGRPIWPPEDAVKEQQEVFGGSWIHEPRNFSLLEHASTPGPATRNGWTGIRLVKGAPSPA